MVVKVDIFEYVFHMISRKFWESTVVLYRLTLTLFVTDVSFFEKFIDKLAINKNSRDYWNFCTCQRCLILINIFLWGKWMSQYDEQNCWEYNFYVEILVLFIKLLLITCNYSLLFWGFLLITYCWKVSSFLISIDLISLLNHDGSLSLKIMVLSGKMWNFSGQFW